MKGKKIIKEPGMKFSLRPVILGLLLGLIGLVFGIFWAAYITVNHEQIHMSLSQSARAALQDKFVISPERSSSGHERHLSPEKAKLSREHGSANGHEANGGVKAEAHSLNMHEDPVMEAAHDRLVRGHLHAMGLGLLSIVVSFVFAFSAAPANVKTFASACLGTGGIFYPLAWIIMGFRTPALGLEASQESVIPIVALSVILVLVGILLCFFYFIRDFFRGVM